MPRQRRRGRARAARRPESAAGRRAPHGGRPRRSRARRPPLGRGPTPGCHDRRRHGRPSTTAWRPCRAVRRAPRSDLGQPRHAHRPFRSTDAPSIEIKVAAKTALFAAADPRASAGQTGEALKAELSALGKLGRFAGLVEAGLLALDDPGVALEEAGALERLAQVGIGLDERSGDPVARGPGLAARAAAVNAHANVERPLDACDLQRRERKLAVSETRKVVLYRPPVEPRGPVAGAQDHARNRGLALARPLVLGGLYGRGHYLT